MNGKCRISVVRFEQWPAVDRDAWDAAVRDGDILDEPGILAHYSLHRLTSVRAAYGRWLGFLGSDLTGKAGSSGVDHLDRDRITKFLEALRRDLAPRSTITYFEDLAYAVRGIAPDKDVSDILAAGRYLRQYSKSTRDKRTRIRPIQDLYELGLELMQEAETVSGRVKAAILFRDGLTIAFLAARPIRVGNLTSIEIDRHLVLRGDKYWIEFPAEEVKNRRPLEIPLPDGLVEHLERYLERHRPVLADQAKHPDERITSTLWLSRLGTPITPHRMWWNICKRTRQRFGNPINPHLFRDAAATSIAIEDPAHVRMTAKILGHATLTTAERYYNQATSIEAARRMQASLRKRRK